MILLGDVLLADDGVMTLGTDRYRESGRYRGRVALGLLWAGLALSLGCDGSIGERQPPPAPAEPEYAPHAGPLRRLSQAEYRHTVVDLLGEGVVPPSALEEDARPGGEHGLVAIGVSTFAVSSAGVQKYEDAAYSLAAQALVQREDPSAFVGCRPGGVVDGGCADQFIRHFGRRAWRRPLTPEERTRLVAIASEAAERLGDFHEGLAFAVATVLQSPNFIFRAEVGRPSATRPGYNELTPWEIATRLSYLLWSTTPDDALLDAAATGALATNEGLEEEARRMLADPKAHQGLRAFFDDMLVLDRLLDAGAIQKDPTVFLHYNAEVGPSAREETLQFLEDLILDRDAPWGEAFTSRRTFIDRTLASIYAVPAPSRQGFGLFEHPESTGRRGLLGQIGFLIANSNRATSSATKRGAYIREVLLCQPIPPPPPDVNTALEPSSSEAPTLRDRVARHLEDPSCAGCHQLMDPLGLGLENFDAIGRYRDTENGVRIDASGYLNDGASFEDSAGLGDALADSQVARDCLVRTLFRYGTGHVEVASETAALHDLERQFAASDYRVKSLLLALATSDAFRFVLPPSNETADQPEVSE